MGNQTPEDTLLNHLYDYRSGVEEAQAAGVNVEDFHTDWNRRLWKAMVAAREKAFPLDYSCLREELIAGGLKAEAAHALLCGAMEGTTCAGFTTMYAQRVKRAARLQRIAKTVELANTRITSGEDPASVERQLDEELKQIEGERGAGTVRSLSEVGHAALQRLADEWNGDQALEGLRTGIEKLDERTEGIGRGELWIVGGLPGRGKTALALQTAMHLVEHGTPVYFISLEMENFKLWKRVVRMGLGAPAFSERRWSAICERTENLDLLPLTVDDAGSLTPAEIMARARLAIERKGARLIVVDYLQIIKAEGRERREAVGEAANQLRVLAKQTGVPVMLLSQLRRPPGKSLNDRPSIFDLKESGDIEAHAHVVLLMYMPVDDNQQTVHGEAEIIIGKQREGPVGSIPLSFNGEKSLFEPKYMRGLRI